MSGFLGLIVGGGGGGTSPVVPSEYVAYLGPYTFDNLKVYNFNSSTGYGSGFTSPVISQVLNQVSFVPDNSTISVSYTPAPYFSVYGWSSFGFGTKYSDPSSVLNPSSGGVSAYTWSKNVDAFLTINPDNTNSQPQAWAWSSATGFGTKYSNGSSFAVGRCIAMNGDGTQVAFSAGTTSSLHLYPWTSSGYGTKYANPTFPSGITQKQGLSFNKVTNDLATGLFATPYIWACSVSSAGFGTQYSNPSTSLTTATNGLQFGPNGDQIAVSSQGAPCVSVYQWGAGFGSKYANPTPSFTTTRSQTVDWSSTQTSIGFTSSTSAPYGFIYRWSTSGFGSQYTTVSGIPANATNISFANKSR
jgi:hypothetical protein